MNASSVRRTLRRAAVAGLIINLMGCAIMPADEDPTDTRLWRAKQEIAELQRLYGQATDLITRDTPGNAARCDAAYQRIFTPDATIGVGGQPAVTGPSAWLEIVKATQSKLVASQHLIGTQVVRVEQLPDARGGGGKASMTSYLMATQIGADGRWTTIVGTYTAQVVHTADLGWQIAGMRLALTGVDPVP